MRVNEDDDADARLAPILREFERRVSAVAELAEVRLGASIEEALSHRSDKGYVNDSPAVYDRRSKRILFNASVFWGTDPEVQLAVIAHETAHALLQARNSKLYRECVEADILAAHWGFGTSLARDRQQRYGRAYADALLTVGRDPDEEVRKSLHEVLDRRLATSVVRPR